MRLLLKITSGSLLGQQVAIEEGEVVRVGRTAKSDFATDDGFMSGEHFSVEGKEKSWIVRDLKSRNGTRLNGKKITSAVLKEGDQIHAGSIDFVVHIEKIKADSLPSIDKRLLATLPPTIPPSRTQEKEWTDEVPEKRKRPSDRVSSSESRTEREAAKKSKSSETKSAPKEDVQPPSISSPSIDPEPTEIQSPPKPVVQPLPQPIPKPRPSPMKPVAPASSAMQSYEAVTPGGRLLQFLQSRPEPLFALLDATQEKKVLKMLEESGEDYRSLYKDSQNAAIAPYLVTFSANSELLRQMVQQGWGRSWGVYLTCPLQLTQLRDYFRRELMVSLPDGAELFSRFYDPRFFRTFLDSCSKQEGEKFFGPVTSYLMEAEKSEIILEFSRESGVVKKTGHLLTDLN